MLRVDVENGVVEVGGILVIIEERVCVVVVMMEVKSRGSNVIGSFSKERGV